MSWRKNLSQLIPSQNNNERISIIGVGHPLFGDDHIGSWITDQLKKQIPTNMEQFQIITAESNPENVIGPIRKFCPTHLLLLDAVSGINPGEVALIPWSKGLALDTYLFSAPLSNFCTFIYNECECLITLVGIQINPPSMSMELSEGVQNTGQQIVDQLVPLLEVLL